VLPASARSGRHENTSILIADGTLTPGGCRIFSGGGQIDGDLDLQLTRIAQELIPQPEPTS